MSFKRNILILFGLLLVVSCTHENVKSSKQDIKKNEIQYAENLEIIHERGNVLIHIKSPENHQIEKKYCIQNKTNSIIPSGYILLKSPVRSIIALSSTHIGMLSKLKSENLVTGISNHSYVHNPLVLNKYRKGEVVEMGEEGTIPVESIVASKADVLIYSGFGKSFPHEDQLERLGTICLVNYDWREVHPLGNAEWIKLFGVLIGKEKQANLYFNKIKKEYLKLKKIASKSKIKPTLFSGNLVGDIWYSPAGESYNSILFKDAKTDYMYSSSKGTGSVEHSFEEILKDNIKTEFWFNPGFSSMSQMLKAQSKYVHFESVKNNKVYSYNFSGNEFWEKSAIEPQHVLSDLIQILHPELKLKNKLHFYRKLNK